MGLAALLTIAALAGYQATVAQEESEAPEPDEGSVFFVGSRMHSAYLGVRLEEETEWPEGGARVTTVVEDSPADEAGLEVGDIVVSFDGRTIRGPVALTQAIHEKEPGDSVRFVVVRDGLEQTLTTELGDRSDRLGNLFFSEPFELVAPEVSEELGETVERSLEMYQDYLGQQGKVLAPCEGEDCGGFSYRFFWGGRPRLGVQLVDTTPELREHLGSVDGSGVLVSKVLRGTPAEHAGIAVGDLIVRVGDVSIEDLSDLREALAERGGESFDVEVVRDREIVTLHVTLPETERDDVTGPRAALPALPAPPAVPAPPAHAVPPVRAPARVSPPTLPSAPRALPIPPAPYVESLDETI
jgi:predicted metalloprotease with PDZ domain